MAVKNRQREREREREREGVEREGEGKCLFLPVFQVDLVSLQCFDNVGWVTGRASGL